MYSLGTLTVGIPREGFLRVPAIPFLKLGISRLPLIPLLESSRFLIISNFIQFVLNSVEFNPLLLPLTFNMQGFQKYINSFLFVSTSRCSWRTSFLIRIQSVRPIHLICSFWLWVCCSVTSICDGILVWTLAGNSPFQELVEDNKNWTFLVLV